MEVHCFKILNLHVSLTPASPPLAVIYVWKVSHTQTCRVFPALALTKVNKRDSGLGRENMSNAESSEQSMVPHHGAGKMARAPESECARSAGNLHSPWAGQVGHGPGAKQRL